MDSALNNLRWLIRLKTKPTQTKEIQWLKKKENVLMNNERHESLKIENLKKYILKIEYLQKLKGKRNGLQQNS